MKYTTEQLELIAIMFRTQFGDKTLKEVFPDCIKDGSFDIKIGDLGIRRGRFSYERDVDFYDCDNDSWVISFRYVHDRMMFSTLSLPHIPIDDIVKVLNFEDKIGEK